MIERGQVDKIFRLFHRKDCLLTLYCQHPFIQSLYKMNYICIVLNLYKNVKIVHEGLMK